jgi:fimbrial chaperone protein
VIAPYSGRRTAMMFAFDSSVRRLNGAAVVLAIALAWFGSAEASEFSVTPIRVELKPGILTETLTVTNHATAKLRVSIKLMEWTQDAEGKDIYRDSADLVYFPRQMELAPDSKRLVRVGMKTPAALVERTYRLFIEEEPEPASVAGQSQVALYFRFGVPIFLTPAVPRPQPSIASVALEKGKLAVAVKNGGNQHFRLTKVTITDGAAYSNAIQGWYSLAGSERTYSTDIPVEVCQKAKQLTVTLEGDGIRIDQTLNVDPSRCR